MFLIKSSFGSVICNETKNSSAAEPAGIPNPNLLYIHEVIVNHILRLINEILGTD